MRATIMVLRIEGSERAVRHLSNVSVDSRMLRGNASDFQLPDGIE